MARDDIEPDDYSVQEWLQQIEQHVAKTREHAAIIAFVIVTVAVLAAVGIIVSATGLVD